MNRFSDLSKKESYFLSQPHQPFFLFATVWALLLMSIFALAYRLLPLGSPLLTVAPATFHVYGLTFIVFTQFFIGFLYTTFPRFCQSEAVPKRYYLTTFFLYQSGALLFVAGAFLSRILLLAGMSLLLFAMAVFFYKLLEIYRRSQASAKQDQLWILAALGFGLFSHLLALAEALLDRTLYSTPISFTLYLTLMTFSVAQRMVPFFSHSQAAKKSSFLPLVFAGLFLKVTASIAQLFTLEALIDILLSLYVVREFRRWKLDVRKAPPILKILHIALFWFPASLFFGALASLAEQLTNGSFFFLQNHLIALGFIVTMLIGFGTRVTLGHSGQPPHADSATQRLFSLTQLIVAVRLLFSLTAADDGPLFWLFDLSVSLWLLLFIFWSWKFAPLLLRGGGKG